MLAEDPIAEAPEGEPLVTTPPAGRPEKAHVPSNEETSARRASACSGIIARLVAILILSLALLVLEVPTARREVRDTVGRWPILPCGRVTTFCESWC